ncbi:hypothetical protein R0K05_18025, partial [Planococcus sp. SIMBA_160]
KAVLADEDLCPDDLLTARVQLRRSVAAMESDYGLTARCILVAVSGRSYTCEVDSLRPRGVRNKPVQWSTDA